MENNIANISEMSNEQIMKAIGQDDGSSKGVNIPRLGINRSPEDDDGNQLPVGNLFTFDSTVGQNVYGKPNRPIMLKDTGEFWKSIEVTLTEDGFEIDGDSVKYDFEPVDLVDMVDFWGLKGDNIYGLNNKNMAIFINALIPKIQNVVIQKINQIN